MLHSYRGAVDVIARKRPIRLGSSLAAVAVVAAASFGGARPMQQVSMPTLPNGAYVQPQRNGPLDAAPTRAASTLLVIAHNAGDAMTTIRAAVAHHARVIEIDVVTADNQLRARHDSAPRSANDIVSRSQTVSEAWSEAATPAILLDLKTSGPGTSALISQLIAEHSHTRVLVSTPDVTMLDRLRITSKRVLRLVSVGTAARLDWLLGQAHRDPAIQGVSIAEHLLTPTTVGELRTRRLWIQAWTVDSMTRANQLAGWGVNGITTNHLGILTALQLPQPPQPPPSPLSG